MSAADQTGRQSAYIISSSCQAAAEILFDIVFMLQREKLACSWCLGDADGRDVELSGPSGCFLLDVSEGLDGGQTEIMNYL